MEQLEPVKKELNNAMLSLDKNKIVEILNKYNMSYPENEISFWGGIHKSILYLSESTEEQKK